jgi:hypothetical protein
MTGGTSIQRAGGFAVNSSNILVRRYKMLACVMANGLEIITGTQGVSTNTTTIGTTWRNGQSIRTGTLTAQTTGDVQWTLLERGYGLQTECTVCWRAGVRESTTSIRMSSIGAGANPIHLASGGIIGLFGGNTVTIPHGGGTNNTHRVFTYSLRSGGGGNFRAFGDGVFGGTASRNGTQGALTNIQVGRNSGVNLIGTHIDFVMVFQGGFSDEDALRFAIDPYQVVEPIRNRKRIVYQAAAAPTFVPAWAMGSTSIIGVGVS